MLFYTLLKFKQFFTIRGSHILRSFILFGGWVSFSTLFFLIVLYTLFYPSQMLLSSYLDCFSNCQAFRGFSSIAYCADALNPSSSAIHSCPSFPSHRPFADCYAMFNYYEALLDCYNLHILERFPTDISSSDPDYVRNLNEFNRSREIEIARITKMRDFWKNECARIEEWLELRKKARAELAWAEWNYDYHRYPAFATMVILILFVIALCI
jgi:hypothetical protein